MKNPIAQSYVGLKAQATNAAAGLAEYAAALNLSHITDAILLGKVTAFETADTNHKRGKTDLVNKRVALGESMDEARGFCSLARDILKTILGKSYTMRWDEPGFRGKLAVPTSYDRLVQLLLDLKNYFGVHQTHENASGNVTAVRAGELYESLKSALAAYRAQKGTVRTLQDVRVTKFVELREGVRTVLRSLTSVLAPMDIRWTKFGFNMPGAEATPDVPQNVVVVLTAPGTAAVKWDAAARANQYRIWKKVVGVDEEFVLVDSRTELDATIAGLPANATIEIAVSATNTGGESARSSVAVITTP